VQMRSRATIAENTAYICQTLERLGAEGCHIAAFPECCLTGYATEQLPLPQAPMTKIEAALADIAATCRQVSIAAVIGTPWIVGGNTYCSAVAVNEHGNIVERYDKVQLAGEKWATPGNHLSVFRLAGVPCSVIICHDERYPELVRLPVLAGARLVIYISHESDIRHEHKIEPYRAQIVARAVENSVWIVHSNAPADADAGGSHGQSRIIAPDGRLLAEASIFGEEVVKAEIDLAAATAQLANRSLQCPFLADWWAEGIRRVRIVEGAGRQ